VRVLIGVLVVALLATAKLSRGLADTARELGHLLGAEDEKHHRKNDEELGRAYVHAMTLRSSCVVQAARHDGDSARTGYAAP
jgi:hypothetical protein